MTVVGLVLARLFWRLCESSSLYDAPTLEPRVSRRPALGWGDVVRTRRGAEVESDRHRGADPERDVTDIEVGEGGMGRTLASSSARPASEAPLASSAMLMRGPRAARSLSDASDGVRLRLNTLSEGGREPESIVDAG
jgi:hypothetical protein